MSSADSTSSLSSSSHHQPSPSESYSRKRVQSHQRHREDVNACTLSSRVPKRPTSTGRRVGRSNGTKRLQTWQVEILQQAYDSGIQSPGDTIVTLLASELGDRTKKQIRDWFSHRRRRVRESNGRAYYPSSDRDKAESIALEMLLLLRYGTDDTTLGPCVDLAA